MSWTLTKNIGDLLCKKFMAEKYYETGYLCFADSVLSASSDAFISLNKKFSLLNCNKSMNIEELKKSYLLEGLKTLIKPSDLNKYFDTYKNRLIAYLVFFL